MGAMGPRFEMLHSYALVSAGLRYVPLFDNV